MTNRENLPETVAVPVDQLQSWANQLTERPGIWIGDEMRALLPKPKPRLVTVAPDNSIWNDTASWEGVKYELAAQPDLLTLLDETVSRMTIDDRSDPRFVMERIRAALGVTE